MIITKQKPLDEIIKYIKNDTTVFLSDALFALLRVKAAVRTK